MSARRAERASLPAEIAAGARLADTTGPALPGGAGRAPHAAAGPVNIYEPLRERMLAALRARRRETMMRE